jgi:hypothetical protein
MRKIKVYILKLIKSESDWCNDIATINILWIKIKITQF